jgi:serine/threonine protein kinase
MNPVDCPSREELQQLLAGTFPEIRVDEVTSHLNNCPDCQQLLSDCGSAWPAGVNNTFRFDQEQEYQELENWLLGLSEDPGRDRLTALRDYELLEKVGEGGMGVVYKARHTKMDRLVAIKLLSRKCLRDPQAIARFERETRTVGLLDHPHIVRAFDAGEASERHFLVLEYLDGKNMSEVVAQHGLLSVANASEIIRQAALGLQHAHRKGLIHRDLKPSNLMLVRPGSDSHDHAAKVKILDYGLSQLVTTASDQITGSLTDTGQIMGTLEYMAPEQCEGSRDITPQADLYSLGATFYKLLTGRSPYPREDYDTYGKLYRARMTDTPKPVQSVRSEIPDGLAALVDQLLSVTPTSRPSAATLARQLVPYTERADLNCLLVSSTEQQTAELSFADTETLSLSTRPDPRSSQSPPRTKARTAVGLLSFFSLIVLGIVLVIRTPDGKETRQTLPDGTQVTLITSSTSSPPNASPDVPASEPDSPTSSTPPPPEHSTPQKVVTDAGLSASAANTNPDREALAWLLSFKTGNVIADVVTASHNKIRFEITDGKSNRPLPDEQFWLVTIMLYRLDIEDADLQHLVELKRLTALVFGETNVTGAGLTTLRTLPIDNFSWWPHRDDRILRTEDIAAIVQFKKIQRLSLMGQGINAEILSPLAALPELWGLGLFNCNLEPDAMEGLTAVTSLREINIFNSKFHDSFLPSLAKMPFLRTIHTTQSTERMLPLSNDIPECVINCNGQSLLAGKLVSPQSKPQ